MQLSDALGREWVVMEFLGVVKDKAGCENTSMQGYPNGQGRILGVWYGVIG